MMTKKELREAARKQRALLSPYQVIKNSDIIGDKLFCHPWFIGSRCLFVYASMKKEVNTHRIIGCAMNLGKTVCVPRIEQNEMTAVPIKSMPEDLVPGKAGFSEPKPDLPSISERDIDLVIVPGLLFDREGYRIGYGGGYYDQYLSIINPQCRTIGLAFSQQVINRIPREAFDRSVMLIITEQEMIGG